MNPRGKRSEIRLLGAANDDSVRSEVIRDAVFEHLRELGEGFALVADCLQTLGAQRDRYVLEGYWVGLSIRQMAKVLGVTPQAVIAAAKLPFAITHAPGLMLVTDLKNKQLAVL